MAKGWKLKTKISTHIDKRKLKAALEGGTADPIKKAAILVRDEAKRLLNVSGGKPRKKPRRIPFEYWNSQRGGYVLASTPPKPPHKQTAALQRSIVIEKTEKGTFKVGSTLSYSSALEFGKKKAGPRPFMRPALMNVMRRFPALFKGAIR